MRRRLALLLPLVAGLGVLTAPGRAAVTTAPCGLFDQVVRAESSLPAGVTLGTGREGNYFGSGETPVVTLTSSVPALSASWTVRDRSRVLLSSTAPVNVGSQALALPPARPGSLQLELVVSAAGAPVGSACLRYGVGMPGASLAPGALPRGKDWGGGEPTRDVVLHDMLGLGVVRRGLTFSRELSEPGYALQQFTEAAAEARARGIAFVVQIGQGGAAERAALADGTWGTKVQAMVARYKGVVPYWETWNEPNYTYFYPNPSGTDFAKRAQIPFYRAVKAADPDAKVVGGSAYTVDLTWYTQFGQAGGFRYLDVVSVHPYCWQCAPEGMRTAIPALSKIKDTYGGRGKPIWDTESGYKSTVDWRGPWQQADWTVRKVLMQRALGMRSNQFLLEGGWEDWAVIDYFRGVKPAAMALSAYDTILDGRPFLGWVPAPTAPLGVYAARFGPRPGSNDVITAVWTTGKQIWLPLKTRHASYDQMGVPSTVTRAVLVNQAVRYLVSTPTQAL